VAALTSGNTPNITNYDCSIRRLAPDSDKIDIDEIKRVEDVRDVLRSMGSELANIHLSSAGRDALSGSLVASSFRLLEATKITVAVVQRDQRDYAAAV